MGGLAGDVTADEVAPHIVADAHHDERTGGRVDDQVARRCDGADQPRDQAGRLRVGMSFAVDLLGPARWDAVVAPHGLGAQRWLLQHQQIIASPPRAIAIARAQVVPSNQIGALENVGDTEVVAFAQVERVAPAQQVGARREHPRRFPAALVDVAAGHCRQRETSLLPRPFVAVLQLVQHAAVLRVEEDQRRAAVRERSQ